MSSKGKKIAELIFKYQTNGLTVKEQRELENWLAESGDNQRYFDSIISNKQIWTVESIPEPDKDAIWNKINAEMPIKTAHPIKRRFAIRQLITAASILFVVLLGAWLYLGRTVERSTSQAVIATGNDLPPGGDKAVLTLADGRKIILEDASDGVLPDQGNATVTKTHGEVSYQAQSGAPSAEIVYNELSTPRGGQYKIKLPDGTRVWLNAASSIRYPSVFTGKNRKVVIAGEAFFEVKKDKSKPFIVSIGDMDVTVLGTQFNVMGYADENRINTTLVEGSVNISKGGKTAMLKPGEQSIVAADGNILVQINPNVNQTIAWTKGYFHFKNNDVRTILRQISRWYNVDIVFKNQNPTGKYTGIISRNTNASEVLKMLEVGGIHYSIEGNKMFIE